MPHPESPAQKKRAHAHIRKLDKLRRLRDREAQLPSLDDTSVIDTYIFSLRDRRRKEKLERYGRENRAKLTQAEDAMRAILTELGWRFNTEHPVGDYILDFYVHAHRLAIEVDGGYHLEPRQKQRDQQRDRWLVQRNFRVVRLTNEQVLQFPKRTRATLLQAVEPKNTRKVLTHVLPSKALQGQRIHACVSSIQRKISSFEHL